MPGHIKLGKPGEPDPDPSPHSIVKEMSYILKEVPVEQCSTQITSHRVHIGKKNAAVHLSFCI